MSDCDLWEGPTVGDGYGKIHVAGKTLRAHRLVWMQDNGHLEPHQFVCHHCDTPACINIDHLFIGTAADNGRDKAVKGRARNQNAAKTHCPKGHEYTDENTYMTKAGRGCRLCRTTRNRLWARKKRASGAI